MRKFLVLTFAMALTSIPLSSVHADESVNDATGYYDFIPADQLDSSYAADAAVATSATDAGADLVAPPPHGGQPGHPNPSPQPGPGPGHGGNGGGGHHPNPPPPVPVAWQCTAHDRDGQSYSATSLLQAVARTQAVQTCEHGSTAGHCRLLGCRRI